MGNMSFFENLVDNKIKSIHTAYLAKVISTDGATAKIQPLGLTKAYGETAKAQSPLSSVPILQNARYKISPETGDTVPEEGAAAKITPLKAGDIVLCVCCERDITEARKGRNSVPSLGHHKMSASVIVGVI